VHRLPPLTKDNSRILLMFEAGLHPRRFDGSSIYSLVWLYLLLLFDFHFWRLLFWYDLFLNLLYLLCSSGGTRRIGGGSGSGSGRRIGGGGGSGSGSGNGSRSWSRSWSGSGSESGTRRPLCIAVGDITVGDIESVYGNASALKPYFCYLRVFARLKLVEDILQPRLP
jgi:hypothetical protein